MESAICRKAAENVEFKDLNYKQSTFEINEFPLQNKNLASCIISNLAYYYDNVEYIDNVIKNWGLEYKLIILDTLVYIIFYNENNLYIVFKGTTSFKEVLSDIDFIQIDDSYNIPGKMHRGFHNLILKNNVIESIQETLEELHGSRKIIITGHSLGAALATVFYAYISNTIEDVELITFGSPRVGDREFSEKIKSTRFVHGNDIITKLPIFYYKHSEKIIRLGNSYSYNIFSDHFLQGYYIELLRS